MMQCKLHILDKIKFNLNLRKPLQTSNVYFTGNTKARKTSQVMKGNNSIKHKVWENWIGSLQKVFKKKLEGLKK